MTWTAPATLPRRLGAALARMPVWSWSLAAQFICFTLLAVAVSLAMVFMISWDEHGQAMRKVAKAEMISRCASLVRVLEATPPGLQDDILTASNTSASRYWVSDHGPGNAAAWRAEAWSHLTQPLTRAQLPGHPNLPALESRLEAPRNIAEAGSPDWIEMPAYAASLDRALKFQYLDNSTGMGISVPLRNGQWLNSAFAKPGQDAFWNARTVLSLLLSALVLSLVAVVAARGIATPLRRLALAADALGRGQHCDPLPETGPDDVRRTAVAFNRMQERLTRFVDDRTRMLAAIGHDLRTPLTTLRLRAEFVTDDELREKILASVSEIQSMCEGTLAFVRERGTSEETRTVDLAALTESLCEDLVELGQTVSFAETPRISYRCRPDALRRAIRNLVENAVRYGGCARVHMERSADLVTIVVEDDGPGIPEAVREQVFAPFFRLEHSRNRETGGMGLGLAIARTIARHHGGDVTLENTGSGLRATVSLPTLDGELCAIAGQQAEKAPARAAAVPAPAFADRLIGTSP